MDICKHYPLKIKEKLIHFSCNIGCPGTVDIFRANTLTTPPESKLLAIFIPLYEEFFLDRIVAEPESTAELEPVISDILTGFKELYIKLSTEERASCPPDSIQ